MKVTKTKSFQEITQFKKGNSTNKLTPKQDFIKISQQK